MGRPPGRFGENLDTSIGGLKGSAGNKVGAVGRYTFYRGEPGHEPHQLMDSELFSHKKESFTGTPSDKDGLFQAAQGGTLFLDEVAVLPLQMQVKLLQTIQEKVVQPVGAQQESHIDVRILSATHKDLAEQVASGTFRKDLFFRINVIELRLPGLRERTEDIPLLVEQITQRLASQIGITPPTLNKDALATLQRYPFPGKCT